MSNSPLTSSEEESDSAAISDDAPKTIPPPVAWLSPSALLLADAFVAYVDSQITGPTSPPPPHLEPLMTFLKTQAPTTAVSVKRRRSSLSIGPQVDIIEREFKPSGKGKNNNSKIAPAGVAEKATTVSKGITDKVIGEFSPIPTSTVVLFEPKLEGGKLKDGVGETENDKNEIRASN